MEAAKPVALGREKGVSGEGVTGTTPWVVAGVSGEGCHWDHILGGCLQFLRQILKFLALSRKFNMVIFPNSCEII